MLLSVGILHAVLFLFPHAEISHCTNEHMCSFYNRIPLIWHAQDWTGAGLSNIVDCQVVPVPKVLQIMFNTLRECALVLFISFVKKI